MRENCTYGSEGGEVRKGLPYPYPGLIAVFEFTMSISTPFGGSD